MNDRILEIANRIEVKSLVKDPDVVVNIADIRIAGFQVSDAPCSCGEEQSCQPERVCEVCCKCVRRIKVRTVIPEMKFIIYDEEQIVAADTQIGGQTIDQTVVMTLTRGKTMVVIDDGTGHKVAVTPCTYCQDSLIAPTGGPCSCSEVIRETTEVTCSAAANKDAVQCLLMRGGTSSSSEFDSAWEENVTSEHTEMCVCESTSAQDVQWETTKTEYPLTKICQQIKQPPCGVDVEPWQLTCSKHRARDLCTCAQLPPQREKSTEICQQWELPKCLESLRKQAQASHKEQETVICEDWGVKSSEYQIRTSGTCSKCAPPTPCSTRTRSESWEDAKALRTRQKQAIRKEEMKAFQKVEPWMIKRSVHAIKTILSCTKCSAPVVCTTESCIEPWESCTILYSPQKQAMICQRGLAKSELQPWDVKLSQEQVAMFCICEKCQHMHSISQIILETEDQTQGCSCSRIQDWEKEALSYVQQKQGKSRDNIHVHSWQYSSSQKEINAKCICLKRKPQGKTNEAQNRSHDSSESEQSSNEYNRTNESSQHYKITKEVTKISEMEKQENEISEHETNSHDKHNKNLELQQTEIIEITIVPSRKDVKTEQVPIEQVSTEQVPREQAHKEQVKKEQVQEEQVHKEQVQKEQVHNEKVQKEQVHEEHVPLEHVQDTRIKRSEYETETEDECKTKKPRLSNEDHKNTEVEPGENVENKPIKQASVTEQRKLKRYSQPRSIAKSKNDNKTFTVTMQVNEAEEAKDKLNIVEISETTNIQIIQQTTNQDSQQQDTKTTDCVNENKTGMETLNDVSSEHNLQISESLDFTESTNKFKQTSHKKVSSRFEENTTTAMYVEPWEIRNELEYKTLNNSKEIESTHGLGTIQWLQRINYENIVKPRFALELLNELQNMQAYTVITKPEVENESCLCEKMEVSCATEEGTSSSVYDSQETINSMGSESRFHEKQTTDESSEETSRLRRDSVRNKATPNKETKKEIPTEKHKKITKSTTNKTSKQNSYKNRKEDTRKQLTPENNKVKRTQKQEDSERYLPLRSSSKDKKLKSQSGSLNNAAPSSSLYKHIIPWHMSWDSRNKVQPIEDIAHPKAPLFSRRSSPSEQHPSPRSLPPFSCDMDEPMQYVSTTQATYVPPPAPAVASTAHLPPTYDRATSADHQLILSDFEEFATHSTYIPPAASRTTRVTLPQMSTNEPSSLNNLENSNEYISTTHSTYIPPPSLALLTRSAIPQTSANDPLILSDLEDSTTHSTYIPSAPPLTTLQFPQTSTNDQLILSELEDSATHTTRLPLPQTSANGRLILAGLEDSTTHSHRLALRQTSANDRPILSDLEDSTTHTTRLPYPQTSANDRLILSDLEVSTTHSTRLALRQTSANDGPILRNLEDSTTHTTRLPLAQTSPNDPLLLNDLEDSTAHSTRLPLSQTSANEPLLLSDLEDSDEYISTTHSTYIPPPSQALATRSAIPQIPSSDPLMLSDLEEPTEYISTTHSTYIPPSLVDLVSRPTTHISYSSTMQSPNTPSPSSRRQMSHLYDISEEPEEYLSTTQATYRETRTKYKCPGRCLHEYKQTDISDDDESMTQIVKESSYNQCDNCGLYHTPIHLSFKCMYQSPPKQSTHLQRSVTPHETNVPDWCLPGSVSASGMRTRATTIVSDRNQRTVNEQSTVRLNLFYDFSGDETDDFDFEDD